MFEVMIVCVFSKLLKESFNCKFSSSNSIPNAKNNFLNPLAVSISPAITKFPPLSKKSTISSTVTDDDPTK